MKKRRTKKLTLNKLTVQPLDKLAMVKGGYGSFPQWCHPNTRK